jgi:hypothetical protein
MSQPPPLVSVIFQKKIWEIAWITARLAEIKPLCVVRRKTWREAKQLSNHHEAALAWHTKPPESETTLHPQSHRAQHCRLDIDKATGK